MNFLRKLFGGRQAPLPDHGLYLYVKPKMCHEIVEVRVDIYNHPSLADDGETYILRKMVTAARCPFQAEITLRFDSNRRIIERQVENGTFVTEADYLKQREKTP